MGLTACAHGASRRPGATAGMGNRHRPGKLHQSYEEEEGYEERNQKSEGSHGCVSFLSLDTNHPLLHLIREAADLRDRHMCGNKNEIVSNGTEKGKEAFLAK